jgi:6-pyruvoyltetrahydropterin/6-carboxytetrahydropterin synthase
MEQAVRIKTKDTFEAAHNLTCMPDGHKCRRVHGHSYWVTVVVDGKDDANGMLVEYGDVREIIAELDQRYLNEIIESSTTENVARWICRRVRAISPPGAYVQVRLKEGARKHTATIDTVALDAESITT